MGMGGAEENNKYIRGRCWNKASLRKIIPKKTNINYDYY